MDKNHRNVSCGNCVARDKSLFSGFTGESVEHLNEVKTCNFYKKNQGLFIEGSNPRGVYCVNKGKIKVFALGEEGKEQIIQIATDGDVVGFRSMFSGEPYRVSATTLEDSNICFVAKEQFLEMIDTNIGLRNSVMKELSKELGDRAVFITNMAQKTVRERTAFILILLDKIYEGEEINLSREDMANFVGTATETLIRLLKEFKEDNLIEIHTRKLQLVNKPALIKLAGILG